MKKISFAIAIILVILIGSGCFMSFDNSNEPTPSMNWSWNNPLPQGNQLYGVWGASASDVYTAGVSGAILHYGP